MQYLEGPREHVINLFTSIEKDDRHHKVFVIMEGDIQQRNFEHWSMGFQNMDNSDGQFSYDEFVCDNLYGINFHRDSVDAYNFMVSFNKALR